MPLKFQELLKPGKLHVAISVGDLGGDEEASWVRSLAKESYMVRGEGDGVQSGLPASRVITVGDFRLGICHGHHAVPRGDGLAVEEMRCKLGVDVLCTGMPDWRGVFTHSGGLHVCPGSLTGATGLRGEAGREPSFAILDVQGSRLTCYSYLLDSGDIRVEKASWHKP